MSNTATHFVQIGPFPVYFGNVNVAMGLRGHHHTAAVTLTYAHPPREHGFPAFQETNDAVRERLKDLTRRTFRDATNEVVAQRLWDALVAWTDPSWLRWGGHYWLHRLDLDVEGVRDDIGHDASVTRYTITRPPVISLPPNHLLPRENVHDE